MSLCRHLWSPGARPRGARRHGALAAPPAGTQQRCSDDGWRTAPVARGLRLRGSCDPCGGGRTGSRDPHGCASAGGNRAPCAGAGCSAGTYACSRALSRGVVGTGPPTGSHDASVASQLNNWHRLPARRTPEQGPVVDMRHRSNRFRPANGTRRLAAGSIRPGSGAATCSCLGQKERSWHPGSAKSGRHAERNAKPVENQLPGPARVVSVRTPGTLKKRTKALNLLPVPLHTLWTKVWTGLNWTNQT